MQPLPDGALAPRDLNNKPWCKDCNLAHTLTRLQPLDWHQARIAVANNRQEILRLPGVKIGLAHEGLMEPSEQGDLKKHQRWLTKIGLLGDER